MSALPPPDGPQPEPPAEPSPEPPDETPWRNAPRPNQGGSVWLGILIGVLFFAGFVWLSLSVAVPFFPIPNAVVVLAYIVAAAVLSSRRPSARLGSGLLIAIGVSVLLGAGVCTTYFVSGGRVI